jgi:hypothetical protein
MQLKFLKTLKPALLGLTWLGVASKLLIPIGYMPAPISEGGLMFCPAAIATATRQHDHEHGGHDQQGGKLKWDQCPYGALAKSMPVAVLPAFVIETERAAAAPALGVRILLGTSPRAFHARAPPASIAQA